MFKEFFAGVEDAVRRSAESPAWRGHVGPDVLWSTGTVIGRPFVSPAWMIPGNAKAQRRWRRRDVPNSQRVAATQRERAIIADALAGL